MAQVGESDEDRGDRDEEERDAERACDARGQTVRTQDTVGPN